MNGGRDTTPGTGIFLTLQPIDYVSPRRFLLVSPRNCWLAKRKIHQQRDLPTSTRFGPGLDRQLGQRHPDGKAGYPGFARIFLMHSLGDPLYSAVVAVQWNSCELSKNPPRCAICLFSRRLVANFPVARDSETVCNLLQKNPPNREGKGIRFDRHRSRRPICSCPFPQGVAEHRATRDRTSIFRGGSAL